MAEQNPQEPKSVESIPSAPEMDDFIFPSTDGDSTAPITAETSTADIAKADDVVEDIVKADGDESLKARDAAAENAVVMKPKLRERFKNSLADWWDNPRKRYVGIAVITLLLVLAALPFTRYFALGLFLKSNANVTVMDSLTKTPVSGATVVAGSQTTKTDATGHALLKIKYGTNKVSVSKQYYKAYSHDEHITLSKAHNTFTVALVATGRQVPIRIVNKITGKPISGAEIKVLSTQAKTDKNGMATIVLPIGKASLAAAVSSTGYNGAKLTVIVTSKVESANTFSLTPAGQVYFLSNLSGKIDVVKTNLDGTNRQTVLAGTGKEDAQTTSLLASRDWRYLALLSKRSGSTSIYLIDTTQGDKLTTIDEGDAVFNLVGWSGDTFVYGLIRNNVKDWQPNQQALKSYAAPTGKLYLLAQTSGTGTSDNDWVKQTIGESYIIDNQVIYTLNWNASYYNFSQLNAKQATLNSIKDDGSSGKTIKSFSIAADTQTSGIFIDTRAYEPAALYLLFSTGGLDTIYKYEDGQVKTDTSITANDFYNKTYATYLLSPSSEKTFWAEARDGKSTLFIGDANAGNQQQIASLSEYSPYGWYSDDYILVAKNSSELYIMPASGGTPQKLTDYYKPAISYNGYGGGYGGL